MWNQCVIPGSVPFWTRSAANLSNSRHFLTVPPEVLHLAYGYVYAPSIMVSRCDRSLAIQLGHNCNVTSEFHERSCPMIRQEDISIETLCNELNAHQRYQTLSFNIIINEEFVNGQDNISVYFIDYTDGTRSVSGYLYFNSQPSNNCYTITDPIQCNCTTTGDSGPKQTTEDPLVTEKICQQQISNVSKVCSGSKLNRLHISGFLFTLVMSLFFPS